MNKQDLRRYAPIGLILAGLAVVVSFVLFMVYRAFDLRLQISLGFIVIGLATFILLDPQKAREALTGRQARYGSNSLIMTAAVIGILIVINTLVSSYSKQWDLTEDKQNTLTPETTTTLASLKMPVRAEAYYSSQMPVANAQKLLSNYQSNSKGKFTFEIVDPVKDPIRAQQAKVTRDGTIVLRMEDRQEQISFASEEEITGGLVRLANPGKRAVYFLTGHGEKMLDSSSDDNFSQVSSSLKAKNYSVAELNLLANPTIPSDALAIIVAGPKKPLTGQEITLIQAYQGNGGALVYLSEPRVNTQFGDQVDPMVDYLKTTWGILLDDDVLIDFSPNNNQHYIVYSNRFNSHAITERMYSLALVLPTARSVRVGNQLENNNVTELALTTENAWGETDIKALLNNQADPDQSKDHIGPVSFAAAGENQKSKARVVVVGDADFAASTYFNQLGNSDFILNSIDWAAQQDNLISLTPRQPIQRFMVPAEPITMNLVLLGSVFLLPGLVIITGVFAWLQRRRKG